MAEINSRDLTIEALIETPLGTGLEKAFGCFESIQETVFRLVEKDDPESYTRLKVGTILTWAVLNKLAGGKKPKDLTQQDWEDVAGAVSKYAVMMEDEEYTIFTFRVYGKYITAVASEIEELGRSDRAEAIGALAEELETKTEQFKEGLVTEPAYVEECLWICLEASMKIVCAYLAIVDKRGITDFAEAGLLFALQYSRLKMYRQAQALLEKYLRCQRRLDGKLERQFVAFQEELTTQADQFNVLIQEAFSTDFRTSLRGSADLARAAGVKEADILETIEDVDAFFM